MNIWSKNLVIKTSKRSIFANKANYARCLINISKICHKNREGYAGLRKIPGTMLINDQTGEVVYTPQDESQIRTLMNKFVVVSN